MKIEFFDLKHLDNFEVQNQQSDVIEYLRNPENIASILQSKCVYSGINDDGETVAIIGIFEKWHNCGAAWSIFSNKAGPYMVKILRAVKKVLMNQPLRRIETTVLSDFKNGHKMVDMLGFKKEGTMRCYDQHGNDHDIYSFIRV